MKKISRVYQQHLLTTEMANFRMVIDCPEISVATPSKMDHQKMTLSSYKLKNTFRGCVGITPNRVVTYVSSLFPGCYSDKEITNQCGILKIFKPGDSIMVDKGFLIHDLLPPGVALNSPPF